jgi:hypothetical protein
MKNDRRNEMTLVAAVVATAMAVAPAWGACFEDIGCTNSQYMSIYALRQLSCDSLWTARNTIFYENGYCFKTSRALSVFSNAECSYPDQATVPLNDYERSNIAKIVQVERQKGCR